MTAIWPWLRSLTRRDRPPQSVFTLPEDWWPDAPKSTVRVTWRCYRCGLKGERYRTPREAEVALNWHERTHEVHP